MTLRLDEPALWAEVSRTLLLLLLLRFAFPVP